MMAKEATLHRRRQHGDFCMQWSDRECYVSNKHGHEYPQYSHYPFQGKFVRLNEHHYGELVESDVAKCSDQSGSHVSIWSVQIALFLCIAIVD
ncbi:hypothetical protein KIN20_007284 [Parelaphostrongylus tenuis]|uniref:Uncharacterized protein n=1 Tax=Parelaphostrongylus tenuis TaxID=148309 RepID=A0AAD5QGR6_PARTN|nr:hypothetical protein KIN20_007284 [Parelaphostrongylus tenuis]